MELSQLKQYCTENNISFSTLEPMSLHTSFKIGGPADIFISVSNKTQLIDLLLKIKELKIPVFILGKGSNLLVSDRGIEGAVINLSDFKEMSVFDDTITVGAGLSLSELCRFAADVSLSGLEFAYGIPGSVGGALYMNAGAYGGEMSNVVLSAEYVTFDGKVGTITASQMDLGYRTSVFKKGGMIITNVTFKLSKGNNNEICAAMEDYITRRKTKQPLEYPSAGSTFKRPEGYFAGALIEKNGLKGKTIGGAEVSEKHSGFIINKNKATCRDVVELIEFIQNKVFVGDGVRLEPEVILIGKGY